MFVLRSTDRSYTPFVTGGIFVSTGGTSVTGGVITGGMITGGRFVTGGKFVSGGLFVTAVIGPLVNDNVARILRPDAYKSPSAPRPQSKSTVSPPTKATVAE